MKSFTDIFIQRPVLATVFSLLIIIMGLKSVQTLSVREYPEVVYPVVSVMTAYPGASADLVQGFITSPLQKEIASVKGLDYITSESNEGISTINVYLQPGYDIDSALVEVTAKVNRIRGQLPENSELPIVDRAPEGSGGGTLQFIAFYSEVLSAEQMTDYLERVVRPVLSTVPGVGSAEFIGKRKFAMRVWLDKNKMAAMGVTANDVTQALKTHNVQSAGGEVRSDFISINIDPQTSASDASTFRDIVIKRTDQGQVHVGDVAKVELGAEDYDASIMFSGRPSIVASIKSAADANPLDVAKSVRQVLPQIERQLPTGMGMKLVFDASDNINDSIYEVIKTLLEASLIVVVIIFLFLGSLRSVMIPMVTIPLSLVGVCIFMQMMGYSVNLLTLLAMVLAIGLVVDDAIVVLENIQRHIDEGMNGKQAALLGAREIAFPIVAMTLTLAAVYLPIGFLGGLTGKLFTEFAFTLAGAVIVSGIVALTLSPMMCSRLLRKEQHTGLMAQTEKNLETIARLYRQWLIMALENRKYIMMFAGLALVSIVILYRSIPSELAPQEDNGGIFSFGEGPLSANPNYTTSFTKRVSEIMQELPEHKEHFIINGMMTPNTFFSLTLLKPDEEREKTTMDVHKDMTKRLNQVAGLQIYAFMPAPLPGGSGDLPLQFVLNTTSSYELLQQVSDELLKKAQESGLFLFVSNSLRHEKPMANIQINREKAAELGITMGDVGSLLGTMLSEADIARFSLDGQSYKVIPQVMPGQRINPDDIGNYYLKTKSGDMVPLSTIASISYTTKPNVMTQFQQLNSTTIAAMPMPGVSLGDAIAFFEKSVENQLPSGFDHGYTGQSRQFLQEGNQLIITFLFSFLMIYLVLAAQFESFTDPVTVLVSVPMSICGALVPLALGLGTLNLYTQIGLVTLIGLISKHGILIVDFANRAQRERGLDIYSAVVEAAVVRLRPILMTTAAMVFGVIPLLTASGAGANSRFDIGIVITAGMSIGTIFTLFVVPVMYTFFASRHTEERIVASGESREQTPHMS